MATFPSGAWNGGSTKPFGSLSDSLILILLPRLPTRGILNYDIFVHHGELS